MYNFFGYTSFNGFMKIWAKQGLVSDGWAQPKAPFVKSVNWGIKENVYQHAQIQQLEKYSRFVSFVTKVRAVFLAEFQEHKDQFPGVNGEASEYAWQVHLAVFFYADLSYLSCAAYLNTQCLSVPFSIPWTIL